jgi:copper chaperone CopZ
MLRYLQIGVVALSLGLLAALFATTKPGSDLQPASVKNSGTDEAAEAATPKDNPLGTAASDANQTLAVLAVKGMTCSGCIAQINSSLAGIEGIHEVSVDLANSRVEVTYDRSKIKDAERIAAAISTAGYPATLKEILTAKDIGEENRQVSEQSKRYIARVGDWNVSRADFETELKHARKRYEKIYGQEAFTGDRGENLLIRLKSQVASRLIDEGIQLNEIKKAEFKVSPDALKAAFDEFLSQRAATADEFKRTIKESGLDYDYFLEKFENRATINTYVEEKVLAGLANEREQQQQYEVWFNNARLLTPIVYFDKDIENSLKSAGGPAGCRRSGIGGKGSAEPGSESACIRKSSAGKAGCKGDCTRQGSATPPGCPGKCKRQ